MDGDRYSLDSLTHPIVQAPMAGGPSTPALSAAGALGTLAAGYRTPEDVRADIEAVRASTDRPFGVNLFAPPDPVADPAAIARYADRLAADGWAEKLDAVAELRVPVVSFTFGCPPEEVVARLHDAGAAVWVTVTTPAEARTAAGAGADAL